MSRYPVSVHTLFLLAICPACIQRPNTHATVPPEWQDRRFAPAELGSDLDEFVVVAESVHPNLYAHTPRSQVDALRQNLKKSIAAPMTRVEFYPLAACLAASFGDPHTYAIWPSEEWSRYMARGGRKFPLDVEYADGALRVIRAPADEPSIQPGDLVVRINSRSVAQLFAEFRAEHAGREAYQAASFSRALAMHLWIHGVRRPFEIEFSRPGDSTPRTAILLGEPLQVARRVVQAPASAPVATGFSFHRLPGDVGYLDFRQMSDAAAFDAFLRRVFTEIRDQPVTGLIVDLRANGGGDSGLGVALLDYINGKPYKMAGRKEWRASRRYKDYMKSHLPLLVRWMPLEYLHPLGRKFFSTPDGGMAIFEGETLTPGSNALRYQGPVCFLIGPNTFSSAMMLANAVKDYKLATLIGEETGGVPNAFGEVYMFDLPNTRLAMGVSSAFFVRSSGEAADQRGVLPDIEARPTTTDRAAGMDTVLKAAKGWIAGQPRP